MPANKSQHYVPRVYLKPFSYNDGRTINLHHVASGKLIPGASLGGQCAGDYFYGKDGELEKALSKMEGVYGTTLRKLSDPETLTDADLTFINDFAYLQYSRTEASIQRGADILHAMYDAVNAPRTAPPVLDRSHEQSVHAAMRLYVETRISVADLRVCLLENQTDVDFVTSDDPVVMTNRFLAQRHGIRNFGTGSSGVAFFMPMTPRWMMISYDCDVYYLGIRRTLAVNRRADVRALNELQFIKGQRNHYFLKAEQGQRIQAECADTEGRRGYEAQVRIHVPAGKKNGRDYFRLANSVEIKEMRERMVLHSLVHPLPSRWPSFLRIKMRPVVVTNGSAVGLVRPATYAEYRKQAPAGEPKIIRVW